MVIAAAPSGDGLVCGAWRDGRPTGLVEVPATGFDRQGDSWELVVVGGPTFSSSPGQLAHVSLLDLRAGGYEVVIDDDPPTEPLVAWARGQGPLPADSSLAAESDMDRRLAGLLRLDPALHDRLVVDLGRDQAAEVWALAWRSAAMYHPDDDAVTSALVVSPAMDAVGPFEDALFAGVRGIGHWRRGETDLAVAEFRAAVETAGRAGHRGWRLGHRFSLRLAEIAVANDDEREARRLLEQTIDLAPSEEVGRRLVASRPGLSSLLDPSRDH